MQTLNLVILKIWCIF